MADSRISALTAASSVATNTVVPVVRNGAAVTERATLATIADVIVAADAFDRDATNSVARSIFEVISEIHVSVKDFGATGDGTTDDHAAIQAAINSLDIDGGVIFFPPGKYRVTAAINIPINCVTLRGATVGQNGNIGTVIIGAGDHDIITNSENTFFITLETLALENPTSGLGAYHHVNFFRGGNITIRGCLFRNIWHGIRLAGINQATIEDCEVRNSLASSGASYGIGLFSGTDDTLGVRLRNLRLFGITENAGSNGILGQGTGTVYIEQVAITKWEVGLKVEKDSTDVTPYFWRVSQVETENCDVGVFIAAASRFSASDVQVALSRETGWYIGPDDVGQITLTSCVSVNNQHHGFNVQEGGVNSSLLMIGCSAFGNGQALADTYDGLYINETSNVKVIGGQFGGSGINGGVATATQRNGIRVVGSPTTGIRIVGVDLRANSIAAIGVDGGSLPTVIGCAGYSDAVVQTRALSSVNFVEGVAGATGFGVTIRPTGDDTNINLLLQSKGSGYIAANAPVLFPTYTVAGLPDAASNPRALVFCSDLSGGAAFVYSRGSTWRRVSDDTVAS